MEQKMIQTARRVDLGRFLYECHNNDVVVTGRCIHLKDPDSVYTRFGYCGYRRFSTDETGNSIDLLVRYLNYSFKDAVITLNEKGFPMAVSSPPEASELLKAKVSFPQPDMPPYKRVFAYLHTQRKIPSDVIQLLIDTGLLYQEAKTGNAVFISKAQDFCELRGTCTYSSKSFHGIRRERADSFWSVKNGCESVKTAYICEGAIDAISLMVLHNMDGHRESAAYISIGGVCNQRTIDRISSSVHTIIAVDNDEAGQRCRERNPHLESLIPVNKDWNEDLKRRVG